MKTLERVYEAFNRLHPKRQKAIEYFVYSGLAAFIAGVSIVPVLEAEPPANGIGLIGVIGGTVISVIEYKWGWEALKEARQAEQG